MTHPLSEHSAKKLDNGIQKYTYLRQRLYETNVSLDLEFQKTFNGFFRMRQRSSVFYNDFYNWMELHKNTGVSFSDTLTYFFNKHNRLEISFCSKLIALIDPSKPIWDRIVTTEHFGIKAPYPSSKNRLQKAISKYEEYCTKYETYMHTPLAESLIQHFDYLYPNSNISAIKKLDFMLWVDRA